MNTAYRRTIATTAYRPTVYPAESVPAAGDFVYSHSSQRLLLLRVNTRIRATVILLYNTTSSTTAVAAVADSKLTLSC